MNKNSKFEKIYLQIINEQFDPSVAVADDETVKLEDGCQLVSFKTSDKALIDALQGSFSKITIITTSLDENNKETDISIDIDPKAIKDLTVVSCKDEEDEEDKEDEEDDDKDEANKADEQDDECDEQDDECDEQDDECDEQVDDECDEQDDECDEQAVVDGTEWVEDGVCLKCGSSECDGTCVCPKCGDMNCIGDCDGRELSSNPERE